MPRRWAVISANDVPGYLYYGPIVTWQWRRMGYEVLLLYHGVMPKTHPALAMTERLGGNVWALPAGPGSVHSETYCQVSRLFAATVTDVIGADDMITTSDVDMLVFSEPPAAEGVITTWGHDLTSFQHYPICYVSAQAKDWRALFGLDRDDTMTTAMERFLGRWPGYFAAPEQRWTIDQHALTECIDAWRRDRDGAYVGQSRTIEPGSFLPLGRLDRYDWRYPAGRIIDCHMPRDGYSEDAHLKIREMYRRMGLLAELDWMSDYREAFLAAMSR